MDDKSKTKAELIDELNHLRKQLSSQESQSAKSEEVSSPEELSVEKCKKIMELLPDPVVLIQDGVYKFVSKTFEKVFGLRFQPIYFF